MSVSRYRLQMNVKYAQTECLPIKDEIMAFLESAMFSSKTLTQFAFINFMYRTVLFTHEMKNAIHVFFTSI